MKSFDKGLGSVILDDMFNILQLLLKLIIVVKRVDAIFF